MNHLEEKQRERGNRQRTLRIHKGWQKYMLLGVILLALGCLVVLKATVTATVNAHKWQALMPTQTIRKNVDPIRGNIYSDSDLPIAISVPRYVVAIDFGSKGFEDGVFKEQLEDLSKSLSTLIGDRSAAEYRRVLLTGKGRGRFHRIIRREVSYVELQEIRNHAYFKGRSRFKSGLVTESYVRRVHPYGNLAFRTIGRIMNEPDSLGLTHGNSGLEMRFDSVLCGVQGIQRLVRMPARTVPIVEKPALNGMNVYSTLNVDIQDIAEKSLRKTLIEVDADWGCAIVMDVKTGAIKAIANLDRMKEGVYMESTNHALADLIEPGSTFKTISMLAVLENKGVNPEDTIDVGNGLYLVGRGLVIRDHNTHKGGYGKITYNDVIYFSSSVGTARAVMKTFGDNNQAYLDALMKMNVFDQIDLEIPGTACPKIQKDVSKWTKSTMPWTSFGYEVLVPPIYTLRFYNAIANGGKMMEPYLVREVSGNGEVAYEREPRVINEQIASEEALGQIRFMLRGVVTKGTGKDMNSPYVAIAGKTGTAQKLGGGTFKGGGHNVTFCGYFPADNPLYSCIVVVSRPRGVYPSGSIPGKVLREIAEQTIATSYTVPINEVKADSLATFNQRVLAGNTKSIKKAIKYTGVEPDRFDKKSEWVKHEGGDSLQMLTSTTPQSGVMPDMVGMSVMDAVYLGEKLGLTVRISGSGAVVGKQSIRAGERARNGQHLLLTLQR